MKKTKKTGAAKPIKNNYFCKRCNKDHKDDKGTRNWVEFCVVCNMKHPHYRWTSTYDTQTKKFVYECGDCRKEPSKMNWDNFSPEEVLAGVNLGQDINKTAFANVEHSRQNYSEESRSKISNLKKELSW